MTPLERAGRALHEATREVRFVRDCMNPSAPPKMVPFIFIEWDDLRPSDREECLERARAVIEAIREPSAGMKESAEFAGLETSYGGDDSFDYLSQDGAGAVWGKMIGALLEEGR